MPAQPLGCNGLRQTSSVGRRHRIPVCDGEKEKTDVRKCKTSDEKRTGWRASGRLNNPRGRAGGGLAGARGWHAGSNKEYLLTAAKKMKVKALAR